MFLKYPSSCLFDFYIRLYRITVLYLDFKCACVLRFCADGLACIRVVHFVFVCVLYSFGAVFISVYENDRNEKRGYEENEL